VVAWLVCASAAHAADDVRLVRAMRDGDRSTARVLLAGGIDVNAREADGTTALLWAVHHGDVDLVEQLLRAGAQVAAANRFGATPLGEAAVLGHTALIQALLRAGADPRAANPDGQTPLMAVARTGNIEAATVLLDAGAEVDAREGWLGQTALMWAAAENLPAMVRTLVARGAGVDTRSTVHAWDRDVTAEPRRKYMPQGGWTPLLFAARDGALEAAAALIEAGADVNLQDPDFVSPVVMAIVNGHYDVAKLLIERGADVNRADRWGRAALWAIVDMHTPIVSSRPDVVESESVSSTELLDLVLARGADVNAQLVLFPPYRSLGDRGNDNMLTIGATPLLRAAKAVDLPAIRTLLAHGADVHIATIEGITPLLAAAGVGSRDSDTRGRYRTEAAAVEAVTLLLDAGGNVADADGRGQTALHGAAFWGYNALVRLLAGRGAALDARDRRGMTPIDSAMGRAGGNGFGGNRIDVHAETAALLEQLLASRPR
jgi:ankyrin repeat protein